MNVGRGKPFANAITERVNVIIKKEFELEKYAHNKGILKPLVTTI